MKFDYAGYQRDLDRLLERVKACEGICKENSEIILKYYNLLAAQGFEPATLRNNVEKLLTLAKLLDKPFDDANKDDMIKLVSKLQSKYSDGWNMLSYKGILKKFYRWLRELDDEKIYPPEVRWIRSSAKDIKKIKREDILTQEDIEKIAKEATSVRDKALILTLYESGCRIGELLQLQIKNIKFDEHGVILDVEESKTIPRNVRGIDYVDVLSAWLSVHPYKDDPEAPLWVSQRGAPLKHDSVISALDRIKKKLNMRKKMNPHAYRHAKASHLAPYLKNATMSEHFGWSPSSKMPDIYYHLCNDDVDNALLEIHEEKTCRLCGYKNKMKSDFCENCKKPFNLKAAIEIENKKNAKEKAVSMVIDRLKDDDYVANVIVKVIKELKLEKEFEEI